MYLESLKICNYRKFGSDNNVISFVGGSNLNNITDDEIPNIASSSTLIIGKNNTGKTTITNAIKQLVNGSEKNIKASDFNTQYLRDFLKNYSKKQEDEKLIVDCPRLDFELIIGIKDKSKIYLTNLAPFVSLNNTGDKDKILIKVSYQIKEEEEFFSIIKKEVFENSQQLNMNQKLIILCELIDEHAEFQVIFENLEGEKVDKFSLDSLFSVEIIEANRHLNKTVLSDLYHKIMKPQFEEEPELLTEEVTNLNTQIETHLEGKKLTLQSVLESLEGKEHVGMDLQGNVTSEKLFSNFIKYIFTDGDDYIPEDQFGLGYVNLLNIIGRITHYMDAYEVDSHKYRINLLFIEEPEVFMHPQMQEFFITRIDNALKEVLKNNGKRELQCQLVITTHSSHIVNSKIHSSQSFDSINYITTTNRVATAVILKDDILGNKIDEKQLKFLKTHIKYKVSELFFADAIIFVEGMTEETLLPYFLEQEKKLKNYHISIFNIDGAHSQVYLPLIEKLMIPCLIVTDLDIKRSDQQKRSFKQLQRLTKKVTTNQSLIAYFGTEIIPYRTSPQKDNRYYAFQGKINGSYATSLEEALILTNYNNTTLQNVLRQTMPQIFNKIVQDGASFQYEKLLKKSYELQSKLGSNKKKSEFSNALLFELIVNKNSDFQTPLYIQDGFDWLSETLSEGYVSEANNE